MRLAISRSLIDALVADCARDPQFERCGLLLGSGTIVLAVEATSNVSPDPAVAFEIAPETLIAATRAALTHSCMKITQGAPTRRAPAATERP